VGENALKALRAFAEAERLSSGDRHGGALAATSRRRPAQTAQRRPTGSKSTRSGKTVKVLDALNHLIDFFPASVGSEDKPSPTGALKIISIDQHPYYRDYPKYHFKHVHAKSSFTIRPGPNNPVGTVWISLPGEGYGIHGTPDPGKISKAQSHGCVRLTNWDPERLVREVRRGTPVSFVDRPS
jgi:lipoprotein-anchoring transpeptidase ErfK/SrfK